MPTATGHTTAIRASRVIGTTVFDMAGEKVGELEDVILDKTSDRLMCAVIARSGAMTATDNFYPLPWSALDYDEAKGGYVVDTASPLFSQAKGVSAIAELVRDDGAKGRRAG